MIHPGRTTRCVALWAFSSGLLLTAAPLLAGCPINSAEKVEERTIDVKPGTQVHVETRNGSIRVSEGRVGKVSLKSIKKARATSNPRKLLKEIKVTVKHKGGKLHIAADHPSGRFTKQYGVSFELKVPKGTELTLETRNGSIRLGDLDGAVNASSRNGSIKAGRMKGSVIFTTRSGSIRISGAGSSFKARTNNGSIKVHIVDGSKLMGESEARTKNGSITISAPGNLSANVSADTRNGSIKSDFDLSVSGRKHAAGKVGAGGAKLTLRTRNGSIRLEKR